MRILGSDSFGGNSTPPLTSIKEIPVSYLKDGDMCILKDDVFKIVYNYRYEAGLIGTIEDIPNIIIPNDNEDITSDDGGRWILCDMYTNTMYTNLLKTNYINPNNSDTVHINTETIGASGFGESTLSITPSGTYANGPVTIIVDGVIPDTEPPLYINSTSLVTNLNAQYLNGVPCDRFILKEDYNTFIPTNVDTFTIGLPNTPRNTDYSVYMTISNQIDPEPSIYSVVLIDKQIDRFTVKFSALIDSPNYVLDFLVVGAFNDCGITPVPQTNYLFDVAYNYINNVVGQRFTVENT